MVEAPPSLMRRLYHLGLWLVAIFVVWVFVEGVLSVRVAARRTQRANSLKQIGLALHDFEVAQWHLPAAVRTDEEGRPLCSWRFQIVPYLEATMVGIDYGEAWDDPANRELFSRPCPVFCYSTDRDTPENMYTNVVAVTGPGTAFDGDRQYRLSEIPHDTILVVEIANSGTHWMAPGDLSIDDVPESLVEGLDGYGLQVLFADGTVWFLNADVPLVDLRRFFTIDGAKEYDREEVLGPYRES